MPAKDEQGAFTPHCEITRTYIRNEGSMSIPTAGGDPEIVDLHEPQEFIIDSYVVTRIGGPPTVPHPETGDPNLKLLYSTIPVMAPVVGASQNIKTWSMGGQHVYAVRKAKGFDRDIPTGKTPLDMGTVEGNAIPKGHLVKGLMGGTTAPKIPAQMFTPNVFTGS